MCHVMTWLPMREATFERHWLSRDLGVLRCMVCMAQAIFGVHAAWMGMGENMGMRAVCMQACFTRRARKLMPS